MRKFPRRFPGVFPWTTQNKPQKASWNVFLDSIAAAQVYAYGFPTTLFADNACPLAVDTELLFLNPEAVFFDIQATWGLGLVFSVAR